MSTALAIQDVYAAYDKADVLNDVSLSVGVDQITCLLGSNGVGKTTLIRSILGLTQLPTHRIVASGIACIPEGRKVLPKLTVEENLRLGAYQERSKSIIRERIEEAYGIFPLLRERRDQLAGTMSGGEQAMISIGRGLMCAHELLLVDEPSLGLSPLYVKENFEILGRIRDRGITIFLVEQNVRQTLNIADYGYVLAGGKVVASGMAQELSENPDVRDAYFGSGHAADAD